MNITGAVYQRMLGDATLAGLVSVYHGPGGPRPAIFTGEYVPEDAELPYVWSYMNVTDMPDDTKVERGRNILRDIGCFTGRDEDSDLVALIAERVRMLFHRHLLVIDDAVTVVCEAYGPIRGITDENAEGLTVNLRLRVETE